MKKGMIDFYLRWYNGAHCILNGFAKLHGGCRPQIEGGLPSGESAADRLLIATTSKTCGELRYGLLPEKFLYHPLLFGTSTTSRPSSVLVARAAKPKQRDRLRLNRYDEQDFTELVAAMKAEKLWFLS